MLVSSTLFILATSKLFNKRSVLRRQSRDTNRNLKRLVYFRYTDSKVVLAQLNRVDAGQLNLVHVRQLNVVHAGQLNLVHVGQLNLVQPCTPTFLYSDLYLYSAYAAHYV